MAEEACPKCKKRINLEATVCPFCQSAFSEVEMGARRTEHKSNQKALGIGCLVLVGLVMAISMCSGSDVADDAETAVPKDNKSAAIALHDGLFSAVKECDIASGQLSSAGQSGDPVSAYRAANATESACLEVPTNIDKLIRFSENFDDKRKVDATKAVETCSNAYIMKWSAARDMKKVLDGDVRLSVLADMQDTAKSFQAGQFLCAAQMMGIATSYGATMKELGLDDSAGTAK